ncbi:MAG: DUF4468 domain-containing protein [Bacteroidales bacterium]|nr:DUF4468 domain-containing protein [Bacteroidales bacterium]
MKMSVYSMVDSKVRYGGGHSLLKRTIALFIVLLLGLSASAQVKQEDVVVGNNTFEHVFQSTIPANIKQLNAKQWIAKNFGDYKSVLQFEDDANHRIIIKGNTTIVDESGGNNSLIIETKHTLSFTLTIDSKDDRFRVRVEDMCVHMVRNSIILGSKSNLSDKTLSCDDYLNLTADTLKISRELEEQQQYLAGLHTVDEDNLSRKEKKMRAEAIAEVEKRIASKKYDMKITIENHQKRVAHLQQGLSALMNSLFVAVNTNDDF